MVRRTMKRCAQMASSAKLVERCVRVGGWGSAIARAAPHGGWGCERTAASGLLVLALLLTQLEKDNI